MDATVFRMPLYLPAQGASELEATIIEWYVAEGDSFTKGQALAQIDSAKSVFDFESPCEGKVIRRLHLDGETVAITEPIVEIETADEGMKNWIPPAVVHEHPENIVQAPALLDRPADARQDVVISGPGQLSARTRGDQCRIGGKVSGNIGGIRIPGDRHSAAPLGRGE